MRVGSELKAARKKAGLTVEVISKRTKISVGKLVALEKDDFKNLPTGLYLFSAVRAYAREVRVDPEPIVERLRGEFADTDTLDALHALDATGALYAKNVASAGRTGREQSSRLRTGAIAAGLVLIAAAGAGAYLHNVNNIARDERVARIDRPSAPPAVSLPGETQSVSLSSPAPSTTVASAIVPLQVAGTVQESAPATPQRPKRRTSAVIPETEAAVGAVFEELADGHPNVEEPRSEDSAAAAHRR